MSTSRCSCPVSSQMFVPSSTIDWCISRFIWSPSARSGRQQFRHVRAQLPGVRVDYLEFFLDANREPVRHGEQSRPASIRVKGNDTVEPGMYDHGAGVELTGNIVGNIRRLRAVDKSTTGQPPRRARLPSAVIPGERPALPRDLHARRPEPVRPGDLVRRRVAGGRDDGAHRAGGHGGDRDRGAEHGRRAHRGVRTLSRRAGWRRKGRRLRRVSHRHAQADTSIATFAPVANAEHTGHHRARRWAA